MRLKDIDFGTVLDASGLRNFDGRGYRFHKPLKLVGQWFGGSTFVAKTTTYAARKGNMEMRRDGVTPKRLLPDCVVANFRAGAALNAVGLSGPGAKALFESGMWQKRRKPFFLSFMAVGATLSERLDELNGFMRLFEAHRADFRAPVGLQINLSCPNTAHGPDDLEKEAALMLSHAASLGIPLMPKFSVTTPVGTAARIAEHPSCDAVCVSNTVPWAQVPAETRMKLFGSLESPLAKRGYGDGGLSGAPLFPLVLDWVSEAARAGFPKPINAGGGIMKAEDAMRLIDAGAASVFIGSVAFLRPWRVWHIIRIAKLYARLHR